MWVLCNGAGGLFLRSFKTCSFYPGSLYNEERDAKTFAKWVSAREAPELGFHHAFSYDFSYAGEQIRLLSWQEVLIRVATEMPR